MMDAFGSLKSVFDVARGTVAIVREQTDPAYRQARRLLRAAAAHGIKPIQLARLLPESLALRPSSVTTPSQLAQNLSVELIEWFRTTFALRQAWLDGEDGRPHEELNWYKQPEKLFGWMQKRTAENPNNHATLHVCVERPTKDPAAAAGRFFLSYEEDFAEVSDGISVSRHWLLSTGLHFDHEPCVLDLLAGMTIAEHFHVFCVGHVVSPTTCRRAEDGKFRKLLPEVLRGTRRAPIENYVPRAYLARNCQSERHTLLWKTTRDELAGPDFSGLDLDRFAQRTWTARRF